MIRALVTLAAFSFGSMAFASQECTQLKLSCQATYADRGQVVTTLSKSDAFADENWDEPSLQNCASTIYFSPSVLAITSVQVRAIKDLNSNSVSVSSFASQVQDIEQDGQTVRTADYSNTITANTVVGQTVELGSLQLAKPITKDGYIVTDITVKCSVK